MIQLIVGDKGKGKTRHLLEKVNEEIKSAHGSIVYLDKNVKHMYELNNKIRLIDVSSFPITNVNEFFGFVNGIISQDHDLEQMYLDNFLSIAKATNEDILDILDKLEKCGESFGITFVISLAVDQKDVPEKNQAQVIVSL